MKRTFSSTCALAFFFAACAPNIPNPPQQPRPVAQAPHTEAPQQAESEKTQTPPTAPQAPIILKGTNPLDLPGKRKAGYANPYPKGTYEHWVARPSYPKTLSSYTNDELLSQLTVNNSKIIICIPQQRARLYVQGKVAMDWPVSTGTYGHETPTGVFRVQEKEKDHKSNRYGKFINSKGRVASSNADLSQGMPKGMTFRPAGMPNWHRLTWDGVGIHGGRVVAGKRLSHGCIRSPYDIAAKLYEYSKVGMPVYISRAVEDYNTGGGLKPIDVKYRPKPGNDYTDQPIQTRP